jgi:hypothetical protein
VITSIVAPIAMAIYPSVPTEGSNLQARYKNFRSRFKARLDTIGGTLFAWRATQQFSKANGRKNVGEEIDMMSQDIWRFSKFFSPDEMLWYMRIRRELLSAKEDLYGGPTRFLIPNDGSVEFYYYRSDLHYRGATGLYDFDYDAGLDLQYPIQINATHPRLSPGMPPRAIKINGVLSTAGDDRAPGDSDDDMPPASGGPAGPAHAHTPVSAGPTTTSSFMSIKKSVPVKSIKKFVPKTSTVTTSVSAPTTVPPYIPSAATKAAFSAMMETLLPSSTAASTSEAVTSDVEVVTTPSTTPSITTFFPATKHAIITPKPFEDIDSDEEMPEVPLKKKAKIGE